MSGHTAPAALKIGALLAVSAITGVYMGWSAIGEIDPFYYMPREHGTRYADISPDLPSSGSIDLPLTSPSYYYGVDYPDAPEPVPAPQLDPAPPAEAPADAADDMAGQPVVVAIGPAESSGGCVDCGGPYEEPPSPAEEEPVPATPAPDEPAATPLT